MMTLEYDNEQCNQFVQEMEDAGYDVEHYRGRNYWEGPAARIDSDDLQAAIRATSMKLQWDQMGRDGLIVYPTRKGHLVRDEE